ncbi:hypothetical protein ACTXT7_014042 [Hymenolepis weldensis]
MGKKLKSDNGPISSTVTHAVKTRNPALLSATFSPSPSSPTVQYTTGPSQLSSHLRKDTLYMQCSWCRLCYHNKPECFKSALLSVNCLLGKHARHIIPPTWIVKIPNQLLLPPPPSLPLLSTPINAQIALILTCFIGLDDSSPLT